MWCGCGVGVVPAGLGEDLSLVGHCLFVTLPGRRAVGSRRYNLNKSQYIGRFDTVFNVFFGSDCRWRLQTFIARWRHNFREIAVENSFKRIQQSRKPLCVPLRIDNRDFKNPPLYFRAENIDVHLYFYTAVIRPVLEYAAPAWHHLINRTQAQHLESVQKRAIHIIFNFTRCMSYPNVLFVAQLESLDTRRNNLSRSFFQDICKPTSCLHYLIPPPQDTSVTTRLRLTTSLPRPNLRT